jgi:hypothetical protein
VTLFDLFFLISVLFVLVMAIRIAISAIRGRWQAAGRSILFLVIFLTYYAIVLVSVSLATPRRFYAPGERRCFDDWCGEAVTATTAASSPCGPGGTANDWIATVEVSSVARRITQRAPDAHAELEDEQGNRYQPCAASASEKLLTDALGPGESFRVPLPFRMPSSATPAGLILHHGDFPGVVIIGADQSFLHRPALQRLTVAHRP